MRGGNLIAYAILSDAPWTRAPDIPTVDAAGVPGLAHAVLARPLGTREYAEERYRQAKWRGYRGTERSSSLRQRFADIGQEIFPREQQTPEALAKLQKAEIEKGKERVDMSL